MVVAVVVALNGVDPRTVVAAHDELGRKNGALAKDSSHQACQALTLFQLEKVNCAAILHIRSTADHVVTAMMPP